MKKSDIVLNKSDPLRLGKNLINVSLFMYQILEYHEQMSSNYSLDVRKNCLITSTDSVALFVAFTIAVNDRLIAVFCGCIARKRKFASVPQTQQVLMTSLSRLMTPMIIV